MEDIIWEQVRKSRNCVSITSNYQKKSAYMLIFSAIYLEISTFMFIFANGIRQWKETY